MPLMISIDQINTLATCPNYQLTGTSSQPRIAYESECPLSLLLVSEFLKRTKKSGEDNAMRYFTFTISIQEDGLAVSVHDEDKPQFRLVFVRLNLDNSDSIIQGIKERLFRLITLFNIHRVSDSINASMLVIYEQCYFTNAELIWENLIGNENHKVNQYCQTRFYYPVLHHMPKNFGQLILLWLSHSARPSLALYIKEIQGDDIVECHLKFDEKEPRFHLYIGAELVSWHRIYLTDTAHEPETSTRIEQRYRGIIEQLVSALGLSCTLISEGQMPSPASSASSADSLMALPPEAALSPVATITNVGLEGQGEVDRDCSGKANRLAVFRDIAP